MKTYQIVPAAVLVAIAVTLASCGSGRQVAAYPPPPPPPPRVSLVISAGPGYVINRYHDGRYYYRNPQGYMYWRGHGNRYYLDNRYMNRGYHRHPQYRDWRRYHHRR